jgi:hypothetical protein
MEVDADEPWERAITSGELAMEKSFRFSLLF